MPSFGVRAFQGEGEASSVIDQRGGQCGQSEHGLGEAHGFILSVTGGLQGMLSRLARCGGRAGGVSRSRRPAREPLLRKHRAL